MNSKLPAWILLNLSIIWTGEGNNVAKNVREFNALCRLFRIANDNRAKKTDEMIAGGVDWGEGAALYAKISEAENKTSPSADTPVELTMGDSVVLRFPSREPLGRAHNLLVVSRKRIEPLKDQIGKLKEQTRQAANGVLVNLKKALSGDKMEG
ncbi:unnamed protein product, partial [Trypanosoma congolense IL3000]